MRRVSRAPRGGGGRGGVAMSKSPSRSPSKRTGSISPTYGKRGSSATKVNGRRRSSSAGSRDTPVNTRKPAAQMRLEIEQLEGILKERQAFYQELADEGDRLVRLLGSDADDIVAKQRSAEEGANGEHGPPMSEEEEIDYLTRRNAKLTRELAACMEAERRYGNDPIVLDKRNEVTLVKMQIKQVEKEITTLQKVKKRRDGALKEIDRTEQLTRKVRGQQREIASELRTELKSLMEQLRTIEKEDVDAHERHAKLQEQVKLGVRDKDVEELRATLEKQEAEIKELSAEEAIWKERKEGAWDENQRLLAKEQKECLQLEREVDRLRAQLIQKEAELRKSYQPVGRTNVGH